MKSLTQYMYETQKIFEFRIKLAAIDVDADCIDRLKFALNTYVIESIGKPKRLPIQAHTDFPALGPCECHIFDVALKYPVVTDQLLQIIAERARISKAHLSVRTLHESEGTADAEALGKDHKGAYLEEPELKDVPGAQELVGQNRLSGMIKGLETRKFEMAAKEKASGQTTNNIETGKVSPVGSRQNTIPSPVRGK